LLTGQLLRIEAEITNAKTAQYSIAIDFSDFWTVDGLNIPYTTIITTPDARTITKIVSVQNNLEIDDDFFKPRKE